MGFSRRENVYVYYLAYYDGTTTNFDRCSRSTFKRPRGRPPHCPIPWCLPGTDEIGVFQSTCGETWAEGYVGRERERGESIKTEFRKMWGLVEVLTYPSLIRCGFLACITMNASTTVGQQSYRHGRAVLTPRVEEFLRPFVGIVPAPE